MNWFWIFLLELVLPHRCDRWAIVRHETPDRIYFVCPKCLRGWHEDKSTLSLSSRQCSRCYRGMVKTRFEGHPIADQTWIDWYCPSCGLEEKLRYQYSADYRSIEVTERKELV